jgi:hypothetical protein
MAGTLNTFGTNYFDNRYPIVNVNGGIAETTIGATARYFESLNPLNEASWIAVLRRTTRP